MWFCFVLFIPYLIKWSLLNEIKVKYLKYNYMLSIFKWIIWKLEIVENQPIWDILLKYCTCSSKKGILFIAWILILSHNKKDIKVSENSVKNFSDAHSPLNEHLQKAPFTTNLEKSTWCFPVFRIWAKNNIIYWN